MGGICGSDLNLITLRDSPSVSPFASFPFVIGHENVGIVRETGPAVTEVEPGQRVVADPLLPCAVRGFRQPCANCRAGLPNRCLRFTEGAIAPGLLLGSCRDTGGSWGEVFVAHRSQVIPVPDHVSDENAVLAEPFGCALHAVDVAGPPHGRTVLVIGGGVIGLCTIAALRIMAPGCRMVALVRHPFQADMARRLGADEVLAPRGRRRVPYGGRRPWGPSCCGRCWGRRCWWVAPMWCTSAQAATGPSTTPCALRPPAARWCSWGWRPCPGASTGAFVWLKELQVQGVFAAGPVRHAEGTVSAVQRAIELFAEGAVDLSGW